MKFGYKRDISDLILLQQKDNRFSMDKLNSSNLKYYFKYGSLIHTPKELFYKINFINSIEEFDGNSFPIYLHSHSLNIRREILENYNYYYISTKKVNKAFPYHSYLILTGFKQ